MNLVPLNGKYLTEKDSIQWNTYVDKINGSPINIQSCFSVSFLVTEDCNLRCTYCYQHNKRSICMTKEMATKAVDMLFDEEKIKKYYDLKSSKGIILDFIGGEPFLEIELIDYITEYFKYKAHLLNHPWQNSYMLCFSTNGTLYFSSEVQTYLKRNAGNLSIGITVDGNETLHNTCRMFCDGSGSYALASSALKTQVAINPYSSTKLTLCPDNIAFLFDAVKSLFEDIKCHFVNANCIFEEGWTSEHADIFYDQLILLADYIIDNNLYCNFYCSLFDETIGFPEENLDRNWCGGTGEMLAIGVDGTCYPCLRYAPNSLGGNRTPFVVGHVNSGLMGTSSICTNCAELKKITLFTQSTQKCLSCDIASGCALCSAYNYEKFGDANIRATYICVMHHARVRANKYYWQRMKEVK